MAEHRFRIDCIPPKCTSQGKRAVRIGDGIRFFKSKNYEQAEESMTVLFNQHRPEQKFGPQPLHVSIKVVYPFRKSEKKSVIKAGVNIPMTSKPDCDNISKMILDVMTKLAWWEDDAQVTQLHIEKWWGQDPGIDITISTNLKIEHIKLWDKPKARCPLEGTVTL